MDRILIATDGSPSAQEAVDFGLALGADQGAAVTFVHVVPALDVPAGRKPDSFYRRVAEVYAELALLSRRPATDMAEASGVSAASVHRWVAEARRRGHLPRAEPARRG